MTEPQKIINIANKMRELTKADGNFKTLKTCPDCGDYIEFIREPIVLNGIEVKPAEKMPQACYCQLKAIENAKQKEQKAKENQRLLDKFKASEIPPRYLQWNFENVDESENKKVCQKYVDCFDINVLAGNGLFLVGHRGTGKTTLAVCMQKELIKKGYTALIINFGEVLNRIQATYDKNAIKNQRTVIDEFLKFDFLVLDDFGREVYTDKRLENAFLFIDELNKRMKCVCLTANPEVIKWLKNPSSSNTKELKTAEFMGAIWDRLREMCKIQLKFTGESYRGNE